jgi:histone-lysine N-methyltransferase SETMAR
VILHNAPAHTSQKNQLEIDLLEFQCLKHPPYSPDLAPMDFAVFPYIKSFLRGMRFNLSELRQAVMNVIFHMKTDQFVQIFHDWVRRHKKCVELKGDYVKKKIIGLSV